MQLSIEVEEKGEVIRTVTAEVIPTETLEIVVRRSAGELAVDVEELLGDLVADGKSLDPGQTVAEALAHSHRIRHRRVCVDLHFETEHLEHLFPANGTWSLVHRFGCKKFEVPRDACANLELHGGSPTGPALNDQVRIGHFPGCKTVWLVKPGPEPNG